MAEQVGNITCRKCGGLAELKADKRRFLYVECNVPRTEKHWKTGELVEFEGCGTDKAQRFGGQNTLKRMWLEQEPEKARQFLGIEEPEATAPGPEKPEAVPVPGSAPRLEISKPSEPEKPAEISKKSPKKPGFFGSRPVFRANKQRGVV